MAPTARNLAITPIPTPNRASPQFRPRRTPTRRLTAPLRRAATPQSGRARERAAASRRDDDDDDDDDDDHGGGDDDDDDDD